MANCSRVLIGSIRLFCFAFIFSVAGSGFAETTSSLMHEAMRLTAAKQLEPAEQVYRRLADVSPEDGYPALARFLYRSGQTSKTEALLKSPEFIKLDSLTQGRSAAAAGRAKAAAELLENDTKLTATKAVARDEYARLVLLANQLSLAGSATAAASILTSGVLNASLTPVERMDLLKKLVVNQPGDELTTALRVVASEAVKTRSLAYPQLRESIVGAMTAIAVSGNYATFHDDLLRTGKSAGEKWLLALSFIRKGDQQAALGKLQESAAGALSPPEQLVIFEELARQPGTDVSRSIELYHRVLNAQPLDPDRIRVELAQLLYKQEKHEEAAAMVQKTDPGKLEDGQQRIHANVTLATAGRSNDPAVILRTFEQQAKGRTWDKVRELAEAPLIYLHGSRYPELSSLIDARLKQQDAAPEILALKMSMENRVGTPDGVIGALGEYVRLRPKDVSVSQELADACAARALHVATADPATSPSVEVARPVAEAAANALRRAIDLRPYLPENYGKLMELYRLYGQPELARQVPMSLADSTTATVEEIHSAALLLATNGYPEDAIPLYERVLKKDAANPKYRLNYAAALTRLSRFPEADNIYRDLIRNGASGKQYHTHELYQYAYQSAELQGKLDEFSAFLRSLATQSKVAGHDQYLLDAGRLLKTKGRPNDSLLFFETLLHNYPARAVEAREAMVDTYITVGKFDDAERLLDKEDIASSDTEGLIAREYNRAYIRNVKGSIEEAGMIWSKLATTYPKHSKATRGLLAAAQMQMQHGKLNLAEQTLNQYLAMNTGDVDAEQGAREMLVRIQKKEVDPNVLIQSALEEATSAKK